MASKPILIVEDDHDVREALSDVLGDAGYDVVSSRDGREALDVLSTGARPGVILLDLMMPVMDGYQFRAEQLRSPDLRGIPVVVLTADRRAEDRLRELDADAFLSKPAQLDDLLATISRFVEAR